MNFSHIIRNRTFELISAFYLNDFLLICEFLHSADNGQYTNALSHGQCPPKLREAYFVGNVESTNPDVLLTQFYTSSAGIYSELKIPNQHSYF